MTSQVIKKSIDLKAPKQKVWAVLLDDNFTKQWFSAFGEGVSANTDWQVGSKAVFTDKSGSGIIGRIAENKPNEIVSIKYTGVVENGKEDYESAAAKAVKEGYETYILSGQNGATQLSIECNMGAEYFDMMSAAWESALQKIKELSEENQQP